MDFAVASGRMAAEAAVEAIDKDDVSSAGLAAYRERMEDSFVIQDLRTISSWPRTMEHWGGLFKDYPAMAKEIFNVLFSVDGRPQARLVKRITPLVREYGAFRLAREMRGALKSL